LSSQDARVAEQVQQPLNLGGRKKGSTETATIGRIQYLINARDFAAQCLEPRYMLQTNPKTSLPRKTLVNIIKGETEKYGIEEGELKLSTLRGRFRKDIA
jgi:hypothetical protein